ncbi:MAG TPA: PP2C family protein-serine/threonine phosphatase, partial [Thermoanaerobaculia bacterium]
VAWTFAVAFVFAAALVLLFLKTDLLTALLAGLVAQTLFAVYPLLGAADSGLQLQGGLALAVLAVPLIASVRHLTSGKDLAYRYEDIPPHVRRIAERERQRVELETARRIQSSILPDLPPRLAGVDIAHAYLPASEVGGDFYDVLALEDGRLAVAVGDVAGHGVSSGLIMSMAKSALAVQVTFDPEVSAVFNTLNRTVYQTARKRLLATLCYALVDPRRLEMVYASAGHLHPYRISATGRVDSLESTAYPLGVRGELLVDPRTARLSPGDTLFLFSDGVVEARREGSDDMFGFERLEESLARHAGRGPEGLRDGVLADVARFTANAPREDDQTILVLRLP